MPGAVNTIARKPIPARMNEIVIEVAKECLSAIFPSKGEARILATEPTVPKRAITVKENASSSLKYEEKNDTERAEATFQRTQTMTIFAKFAFFEILFITAPTGTLFLSLSVFSVAATTEPVCIKVISTSVTAQIT